jgi:murein L,D-transpeptidase YafK
LKLQAHFGSRRLRALIAAAGLSGAAALAGCQTDGGSVTKHLKPLSPEMTATIEKRGMTKESPILVRVFKEESELEVWKQDSTGQYAHLKTYPICRWSGELGPKVREGDRQAPEGFYAITQGQMNPNSSYYLSFNLGYPNAFDRSHGRSGAHLMVHGDCSSRGCYSMTDEQMAEIYALGRDSFFGGQRSFQVQAYPFRMTAANMAKHRNSPHLAFWKMLKEGNDHFEMTGLEPKVDVCEKRYVFNAYAPGDRSRSPDFSPAGRCPSYEVPQEIASVVAAKSKKDEITYAELVRKNVPTAPVVTGRDGGMHAVFLAKVRPQAVSADDRFAGVADAPAPGTIPAHVNPPRDPAPQVASAQSDVTYSVASAQPKSSGGGFAWGKVGSFFGLGGKEEKPAVAPKPQPAAVALRPSAQSSRVASHRAAETKPASVQHAEARPSSANALADPAPPSNTPLSGAQPVVPAGSFDSRWGGFR